MTSTVRRLTAALAVMVIVTAACGDDDAATTTAVTTATTVPTTSPPTTTELRFSFEGVTGAQDKILVGTVFADGGEIVATVCEPVTSDPFSAMAVAATSAPDNPCGHDAPFGVPLTDEGNYSYFVAIYTGGSQTAESCAFGDVLLLGITWLVIAPADLTVDNCNA